MATVEQKSVRVYRADGTGEAQDELFEKVLTEKGRRANRTLSMSFMLPYSTVAVPTLEIIKPDGKVDPVDVAANSKETIDESQMAMNIYDPNDKILQVNIPKLEIGDVVHSVTRTTTERAIIPGHFSEENVLEANGLIKHLTYQVFAPADRPLQKVALRDEIPGTVTYTADDQRRRLGDASLDRRQRAAHVRRAGHAALRNGAATALCQHAAGLAVGVEMVLGLEPVAPRSHHAGNGADRFQSHRRRANRPGKNQSRLLPRLQKSPLHGLDAGKRPAGFRAARRASHLRQKIRRLPRQSRAAGGHVARGRAARVSRAHQRRHQARCRRARSRFQPRHRLRGIGKRKISADGPDRRKHARTFCRRAIATKPIWFAGPKARSCSSARCSRRRKI